MGATPDYDVFLDTSAKLRGLVDRLIRLGIVSLTDAGALLAQIGQTEMNERVHRATVERLERVLFGCDGTPILAVMDEDGAQASRKLREDLGLRLLDDGAGA